MGANLTARRCPTVGTTIRLIRRSRIGAVRVSARVIPSSTHSINNNNQELRWSTPINSESSMANKSTAPTPTTWSEEGLQADRSQATVSRHQSPSNSSASSGNVNKTILAPNQTANTGSSPTREGWSLTWLSIYMSLNICRTMSPILPSLPAPCLLLKSIDL